MPFFVKGIELFQGVSQKEAERISSLCVERRYVKGTTVFSEGDPSDALYIVKEGLVKLVSVSEKGAETILHILKADEVFGELFLAEGQRPFTAVAIEDVVLTVVPRENFLTLLASVPTMSLNFARLLSKRVMKVEKGLAKFSHSWSYHRLAKVLLDLADKHGEEVLAGTLITFRLTHEDLANLIGTTRETVTTQINRFERMGLLSREDRQLILKKSRLTEFLDSEEMRLGQL
ncbi:MAG: Crp/Fnr family transcriptional regulator [Candidatus Methylomirabilales bacterium]